MIKTLIAAQDTNTEISIGIVYGNDLVTCGTRIIPDVMMVENWVEITDKSGLSDFYITFNISEEIEFDQDTREFILPVNDVKVIIS